jgi:hypothetical protein
VEAAQKGCKHREEVNGRCEVASCCDEQSNLNVGRQRVAKALQIPISGVVRIVWITLVSVDTRRKQAADTEAKIRI